MTTQLQAIRGMHDILPPKTQLWQQLEKSVRQVMEAYGYQEIRLPIVEVTELFQRSIGNATDIVEKEMYSFADRNGDNLTLRPEGTAGCVRAVIENGLLDSPKRLWYQGPMFRHERPQKGRYRQFHQVGVEIFGLVGPDIDLELILLTARLWQILGIKGLELQLNTLGTPEERIDYRKVLVTYFRDHYAVLDEDSRRRLEHNPLRILDSKNPHLQQLIVEAPTLMEHLGDASREHFELINAGLRACNLVCTVNPRLVRGLDYYTRTVFEWVTHKLGSQGTVCAGGRYDGLVEHLGGRPTPAIGLAVGLERIVGLLETQVCKNDRPLLDLYMISIGEIARQHGQILAERLRDALPDLRIQVHCGGGSAKSQFKKADSSGAIYALILGDGEMERGTIGVKPLRESNSAQLDIPIDNLISWLRDNSSLMQTPNP